MVAKSRCFFIFILKRFFIHNNRAVGKYFLTTANLLLAIYFRKIKLLIKYWFRHVQAIKVLEDNTLSHWTSESISLLKYIRADVYKVSRNCRQ